MPQRVILVVRGQFKVTGKQAALILASPKNTWWHFVPDPESFDHIFTDAELYKKYNLTLEEINIIESVIKERK